MNVEGPRWRGRKCVRLVNDMVYLTLLCEGCILAEFGPLRADGGHSQNLLWESPWTRENSSVRSDDMVRALYGDVGAGRFLERFTGHALCLNEFGPASEEDVAAGSGLHGEASLTDWSFSELQHCFNARNRGACACTTARRASIFTAPGGEHRTSRRDCHQPVSRSAAASLGAARDGGAATIW